MIRQGTPVNNEQTINQWQDTWQDHMTNRESHDRRWVLINIPPRLHGT